MRISGIWAVPNAWMQLRNSTILIINLLTGILLTMPANGPAVSFVGVTRRRVAHSPRCFSWHALSKANPRRVWRGFCRHDRSWGGQGTLLICNMFRGVSTVITCCYFEVSIVYLPHASPPRNLRARFAKTVTNLWNLPSVLCAGWFDFHECYFPVNVNWYSITIGLSSSLGLTSESGYFCANWILFICPIYHPS